MFNLSVDFKNILFMRFFADNAKELFFSCCTFPVLSVRLVGGRGPCEGRVEVFYHGSWDTVCDDGWTVTDANVVCHQLSCGPAHSSPCCAAFGQGNGSIVMDDVQCTGSESYLSSCPHRGWRSHNCHHSEDASVVCQGLWLL